MVRKFTLLQLYGYKTQKEFRNNFNKKMSGGVKQYAPPPTSSISRARRVAYITGDAKKMSPGWYGRGSHNMKYPVKVYNQLIPSLGNQLFK